MAEQSGRPGSRWRPTWALVAAVAFAFMQVLGMVLGLLLVVFDLLHDSPDLDGVAARVGSYLLVVFAVTLGLWAVYLVRPTRRTFALAALGLLVVPTVGYLALRWLV